jgi:RNA polymerase sigma factor (sigma-70 family)
LMEFDFSSVYKEQYNKLFSVAYRLTGIKENAEDVIQEAFVNAYKSYQDFRGESQISTWLYKIVVNCSYNYIKKQTKLPVVDISARFNISQNDVFEMIKSYESVEDIVLTNDMRETCLQLFLKCIPKKQKIAFVLKVLLDLSTEEVASIMDASISAVKTNVYRARLSMKENIEDKCSYINPDNPCNCKNWVAYAIKNNRMDQIKQVKLQKTIDYEEIYNSEMDFLSKVVMLYNNSPECQPYEEFIQQIKDMIASNSLKVLS